MKNDNLDSFFKEVDEDIKDKIQQIPDEILKMFRKQAIRDTKKIFSNHHQEEFKDVAYSIYRAYVLGMVIEQVRNDKLNEPKKQNKLNIN